jgi:hypothetical protein
MMARVAALADILSFEGLEPKPIRHVCKCNFCFPSGLSYSLNVLTNHESYHSA